MEIKLSKNNDHDGVPHGVECSQKGNCIPPWEYIKHKINNIRQNTLRSIKCYTWNWQMMSKLHSWHQCQTLLAQWHYKKSRPPWYSYAWSNSKCTVQTYLTLSYNSKTEFYVDPTNKEMIKICKKLQCKLDTFSPKSFKMWKKQFHATLNLWIFWSDRFTISRPNSRVARQ